MVGAQPARETIGGETIDLADVQGNILRGYHKARVRHLSVQVVDAQKARGWLKATLSPGAAFPQITIASHWGQHPPDVCFNLGVTFTGLKALGVPGSTADSFPEAFREGMAARSQYVGDWDNSAPSNWQAWFQDANALHLVLTLHANTVELLDQAEAAIASGAGQAFRILGRNEGYQFAGDRVHFGYRDSISQPRFFKSQAFDDQPIAPLGTVLLGYKTAMEQLRWSLPDPPVLGLNGAFNAFRVLEQDVAGFEAFLDRAADQLMKSSAANELLPPGSEQKILPGGTRLEAMREVVAAKVTGRWRNGTPITLWPHDANPDPSSVTANNFDYSEDADGLKCPFGAHIRRTNPRSAKIVQRVSNHTRRIVRRGFPYGPAFDRTHPDSIERGLLGNFLCANLAAQYEAIQYDWINLGLQDPRITGTNDPLLGANEGDVGVFDILTGSGPVRIRGFSRFVRTRGGAYTFLPSISAMRWIASL
jgi:Dyp-type peroxidase family